MKETSPVRPFWPLFLTALLLLVFAVNVHPVLAYNPRQGDYFSYAETTTVNNGQGSYAGYTDQTTTTGMETIESVTGSNALSDYSYSYSFSSNQAGSTATSGSKSGSFTWSTANYTYVNGTDNQVGYSNPIYVWFAMDPSTPVGGTFWALNTQMTVQSKNYSLFPPTQGSYIQTIKAEGTGKYVRNDAYGVFNATYTWDEYFDPSTGYIVGYNYTEQDVGSYQGQAGGFTYTDSLYVTSTSYPLVTVAAVSATTGPSELAPTWVWIAVPAFLIAVLVIVVLAARGRRQRKPLPEHTIPPSAPPVPPSSPPWQSQVDLGSKPGEQVVIREVAKVNCKYCGTLIPTTVDRCPYCGAPRE